MKMMNNKKNNRTSIVLGTIMIAIIAAIIICVEGAGFGLESKMIKSLADNIHENVPEAQTYKSKYRKANRHDSENETTRTKREYGKYLFVGDSRYKGMEKANATDEDVFICEVGEGYDYLINQMNNIKYEIDDDTALIIGLGVNDLVNIDKYVDKINEMSQTFDCQIYYMLVNPVYEEQETYSGYHIKNDDIDYFNQEIIDRLDENVIVIDTNSYLNAIGFETQDGLHYTEETYENIYNYIKSQL
ncbi:hypothetical protein [Eubacterium sp. LMAG:50]|uniref:hypothetical protein n=1 Tax=Eubacterium sp. LMAG:50 TaxID=1969563 RepID=UPI0025C4DD4B|nr:hypothetical protein [Eubacterium sp. LMAG:50]